MGSKLCRLDVEGYSDDKETCIEVPKYIAWSKQSPWSTDEVLELGFSSLVWVSVHVWDIWVPKIRIWRKNWCYILEYCRMVL